MNLMVKPVGQKNIASRYAINYRALPGVFYQGFDAKPGSGKTSFLEGMALLSRHGFVVGDPSVALVARSTDRHQLSIFLDEVDEKPEIAPLLRKGYRRGVPYVRLNPTTYHEEVYDVYGFKAYTFASSVEKALQGRTNIDVLRPSDDSRLPILNAYKDQIGRPLFEDLFFWYMENAASLVAVVVPVVVVRPESQPGNCVSLDERREEAYMSSLTNERSYMNIADNFDAIRNKEQEQQLQQLQQQTRFPKYIHPAGGVYDDLVIEPLGYGRYLYSLHKIRRIATVEEEEEDQEGKKKGDKKKKQYIMILNQRVFFTASPIMRKPIFAVPELRAAEAWIGEVYSPPGTSELYRRIVNYLELLYDIENQESYAIIALGILTSWLARFILLFFVSIRNGRIRARYRGLRTAHKGRH